MKRFRAVSIRRFGFAHPHYLNNSVGYRGGIRK